MLKCVRCGAETELLRADIPYCLTCVERIEDRILTQGLLRHALTEATHRAEAAQREFIEVTTEIPSELAHPDGTKNIENVSAKLKAARSELMSAHHRLSDFLERGIVPDDLKRSR